MASLAQLAEQYGSRGGHKLMYKQNAGKTLMKHVRNDAAGVHAEYGWQEYVPTAQPFEAKRIVSPPLIQAEPKPVVIAAEPTEPEPKEKVKAEEEKPVQATRTIPREGTATRKRRTKKAK